MTHTWNLYLHYHQCPNCSHIIESRKNYELIGKIFIKELKCPDCQMTFRLEKNMKKTGFRPFFGESSKPEFDWMNKRN